MIQANANSWWQIVMLITSFLLSTLVTHGQAYTIDEGFSDACFEELYDTGGASGNYGDNEYEAFSICPAAPNACITFELSYYDFEFQAATTTDQLLFFEGDQVIPSALITACLLYTSDAADE